MQQTEATRIAVITDVHGNLPALEAVAEDIARRGIGRVFNLGDHVSGPLWPAETAAYLMKQPWIHLAGNCDRQVAFDPVEQLGASDRYAADRLGSEQIAWLRRLPKRAVFEREVLLTHGTPDHDDVYLLEAVEHGRAQLASPGRIRERMGEVEQAVVLCGHSHLPWIVAIDGAMVVNPGSVGLPAYDADAPEPHIIESGSPHARYAVLTQDAGQWSFELVAVPYDHSRAADQARVNGRPDYEIALRSGFMRE